MNDECKVQVFPAFFVSMMRRMAWIPPVFALFAACGGGAPGAGGAKEPDVRTVDQDGTPDTVEKAKAQLERARAQLETAGAHVESQPTVANGGSQPKPTPPQVENECSRLCRAFDSMRRAQDAICRLAGEEDPQCADAKKVVADSAQRVAKCGCRQ